MAPRAPQRTSGAHSRRSSVRVTPVPGVSAPPAPSPSAGRSPSTPLSPALRQSTPASLSRIESIGGRRIGYAQQRFGECEQRKASG